MQAEFAFVVKPVQNFFFCSSPIHTVAMKIISYSTTLVIEKTVHWILRKLRSYSMSRKFGYCSPNNSEKRNNSRKCIFEQLKNSL